MKAALLCTGPSLPLYPGTGYALVIAVKRAALAHPCHVAAILDSPWLKRLCPRLPPGVRVFTRAAYRPRYTERPGPDLESLACPAAAWDAYTATASLVLAAYLGATSVDVYGADWTDEPDYDGVQIPEQNRGTQRWERERRVWGDVTAWLGKTGVKAVRVPQET